MDYVSFKHPYRNTAPSRVNPYTHHRTKNINNYDNTDLFHTIQLPAVSLLNAAYILYSRYQAIQQVKAHFCYKLYWHWPCTKKPGSWAAKRPGLVPGCNLWRRTEM